MTQQIITSPQRVFDAASHHLLESNSFSPIDAVKECSSCKNIPSLFNDLASILASDADDKKDEDRGRSRDNEGVIEEEGAHMGRRERNRNSNTDEDGEEDGDGEQVAYKNKSGDMDGDGDGDGDGDKNNISDPIISRKDIVMG